MMKSARIVFLLSIGVLLFSALVLTLTLGNKISGIEVTSSQSEYPSPLTISSSKNGEASLPSETITAVVLDNGWFLYSDPDGEFSFAYPPIAHIDTNLNPVDFSKNINIQFKLPDKPYQGMSIHIEPNPEGLENTEIARKLFETGSQSAANADYSSSLEQISVGVKPAIRMYTPTIDTEVTVIVTHDDKTFIFTPLHDATVKMVEKEILVVFYQILDTFKFSNSE